MGGCRKGRPLNHSFRGVFIALAVSGVIVLAGKPFVSRTAAASFGSETNSFVLPSATVRTVALSGAQAPSLPAGVQFTYFESVAPTINELGQTAFQARLQVGNEFEYSSIWSEGTGILAPLAIVGTAAPGMPPERPFSRLYGPVIDNAGAVAFTGDVEWWHTPAFPGDVIIGNHAGIWSNRRGSVELAVRMGDSAPGASDGIVFDYFRGHRSNDFGNIAILAMFDHKIDGAYDQSKLGIWSEGIGGGLRLVALTGAAAPGVENGSFQQLYAPLLNNRGHVAFQGILQSTLTSAARTSGSGIWSDRGGSVELVLRNGAQLPVAPNLSAPAIGFSLFSFNGRDDIAFSAIVRHSATEQRQGLRLEQNGNISPIMVEGDWAPGTPQGAAFSGSGWFALNDSRQVAFSGTLEDGRGGVIGQKVPNRNDSGLWFHDGEELNLIARVGDLVPNDPTKARFLSVGGPVLNARGKVAFNGLATTVDEAGNESRFQGIWVADPGGQPRLVVRTGVPIDVKNGEGIDLRTLVAIDFASSNGNLGIGPYSGANDGRGRILNDRGQLAFHGQFEDGSYGVFVLDTLAIPEPRTLVMLAMGWFGLRRPGGRAHYWNRKGKGGQERERGAGLNVWSQKQESSLGTMT